MIEEDPYDRVGDPKPTKVQLKGQNVKSTFDTPLRPDALKALHAAIRKHLHGRRPGDDAAGSDDARRA
jgi:hypothetical protein